MAQVSNIEGTDYQAWLKRSQECGVIPPNVRRVIIDAPPDGAIKVYYECYADTRMFTIELADALKGCEVIHVEDVPTTER